MSIMDEEMCRNRLSLSRSLSSIRFRSVISRWKERMAGWPINEYQAASRLGQEFMTILVDLPQLDLQGLPGPGDASARASGHWIRLR